MSNGRTTAMRACGLCSALGVCLTSTLATAQTVAPNHGAGANPERGPATTTPATAAEAPPGAAPAPAESPTGEPPPAAATPAPPAPTDTPPPSVPEEERATLRVEAMAPGQQFDVQFVSAGGASRTITGVSAQHPVSVADLAPGTTTLRITGAGTFERRIELDPGRSILRLSHAPARTGYAWGAGVLGVGVALLGGAVAIAAPCFANRCDAELQTGFSIPMLLLGVAGVGVGIAMLAWHVPAQDEARVDLDFSE